jgi:hypothetical protein
MKTNSNLPSFTGYYQSIISDPDTSNELDYINELRLEKGFEELENDNNFDYDYDQYFNEWNVILTDSVEVFLQDLGIIKSIKFIKLHSPKYYNFENDVIECSIDINVKNCKKYINENLESFESYLRNNFKSYDGFSSFYEYDLNFWIEKMNSFKNLDHIEIHAILDFICKNENFDIINYVYNDGMIESPYLSVKNMEQLTN